MHGHFLAAFNQHVVQTVQGDGHVLVRWSWNIRLKFHLKFCFILLKFTCCQLEENPIQMRVEVEWVDVKCLSLSGKHNEHHLNGMQALTVIQVIGCDKTVQHFHQVGEEFYVDRVGKSVNESNNTFFKRSSTNIL